MNNENRQRMISLVNKWKGSGIPIRSYAQQIGVSKSKFEYWVRKQNTGATAKVSFAEFIEVGTVTENREPGNDSPQPPSDRPAQIVFTFPSGLCVKIYG